MASEIDTWTPKLSQHSTPTSWPSNGEYKEGYKAKKKSTSHAYNRETTVNDAQHPLPDIRLTRMRQREVEEQRMLQAGIQVEHRLYVMAAAAAAAGGAATTEPRRSSRFNMVAADAYGYNNYARWKALQEFYGMLVQYQPLARLRRIELEGLAVCL